MPIASGKMELWRRLALLLAVVVGMGLFFYVAPAMVSVTLIDWQQEQADELKSVSGYVSENDKRLSQLPLNDYIAEKTGGQVNQVDPVRWEVFFQQIALASRGNYEQSVYGNRVSEQDKDPFWKPQGPVPVFFKPGEIDFAELGLFPENAGVIISRTDNGRTVYLQVEHVDYLYSVDAMSRPYRMAPGWLYHPYRQIGTGIMLIGLLLYIFLPRRKKNPQDIAYAGGRLVAGDIVALILLISFYSLPFLINGGTLQAVTGMWPISLVMWILSLSGILLLYYSAWYASYRIELTPEALYLVTFKGVKECRFNEMTAAELVSLRNPGWFRKLFLALALLAVIGGRSSPQPAGSALLAASAAYGGLEIRGRNSQPFYIWFTDQMGNTIIPNFDRVPEAIRAAGMTIQEEARQIEGFSMFM